MDVGMTPAEVAIIRPAVFGDRFLTLSPYCRLYSLRSITDAEGTLIAAWDWAGAQEGREVRIVLRAAFDVPGMGDESNRLVYHVARRLADLAGVDTAPIVVDRAVRNAR